MVTFEVNDMTCGRCVSAISKALRFVDPCAQVQVDLATRRVQIEPSGSSVDVLRDAIKVAGYTPVALPGAGAQPVKAATHGGCCCG